MVLVLMGLFFQVQTVFACYVTERPRFKSQVVQIDKKSFRVLKDIQSRYCLGDLLAKNDNAQFVLERVIQCGWIDGYTS